MLGGGKGLESLMSGHLEDTEDDSITEESESKYLTLSWWLLHVGWKDVGERVRRGVEEVFYGYVLFFFLRLYSIFTLFSF